MKKLLSVLLAAVFVLGLVSCGSENNEPPTPTVAETTPSQETKVKENVNLAVLKGPTGMGAAYLISKNENNEAENNYNVTLAAAPDEITAGIINESIDIAAVPVNLASVLYNKTEGNVTCIAVNTLGVLYLIENGETIQNVNDLKGKTIYSSGKGSSPEYVLNYILEKNGLDPEKDVNVEYLSEHSEVVSKLTEGAIGVLPEPMVSTALTKVAGSRIALNLNNEWKALSGTDLVMGCLVANNKFLSEKKDAVEKFLSEYKASVDYVNENQDEASDLIAKLEIVPNAAIAKKAIPNCNIVCLKPGDVTSGLRETLKVLFDYNPKSIGGQLPGEEFYY